MTDDEEQADGIETDRPLPPYYRVSKTGGAATVLGAAMIAVGEILEPKKASVEIVHVEEDSMDDDQLALDFGSLPELD